MSGLPVGILLAAGQSQRFGSNKLLYPVIDNTPMLLISARTLTSVLPDTVAVISQQLQPCADQLEQLGMRVVLNTNAQQGIGSSIACGVRASQFATAWLIALADMPYIRAATIQQLADRLQASADIVAPVFENQRGHPVGFGQRYQDELMALNDDVGARDIIASHLSQLELVPTDDGGVLRDIDHLSNL